MSWDISLCDENGCVEVERFTEGGTYAIGGSTDADLNVTYNYGKHFDFRDELHGKKAADVIPLLEAKVAELGTERDRDYWNPTPGNVGYTLALLLRWAQQYPDAVFDVM